MGARIVHNGDTVIVSQNKNVVTVSSGISIGKPYTGAYEATPSWDVQTFKTAKLTMKQDFTVYDITKLEVANDSGGLTLTI